MHRTGRMLLAASLALTAVPALAADRYVLVSHAPDSDSWWNTIKNAQKQAAEDFGVTVDFRNPPNGDVADQARLIEQAAAQNYDGVMSSISDFRVLEGAIKRVTDKRIPLITINSGSATCVSTADSGVVRWSRSRIRMPQPYAAPTFAAAPLARGVNGYARWRR